MNNGTPALSKDELRRSMKTALRAVPSGQRAAWSSDIRLRLQTDPTWMPQPGGVVAMFGGMATEPDLLPLMTWLKVAVRLRTIGEHYALEYDHIFRQTRTTYPSLIERLLIAPKNIAYHLDHHLYPSVPFYNLPELHRELLKHDEFRRQAPAAAGSRSTSATVHAPARRRCGPTPAASR